MAGVVSVILYSMEKIDATEGADAGTGAMPIRERRSFSSSSAFIPTKLCNCVCMYVCCN